MFPIVTQVSLSLLATLDLPKVTLHTSIHKARFIAHVTNGILLCLFTESPQSPPNKRVKKVSQEEQMVKDMKECFAEIARTLEERERLRLLEQRQHEERLRKEAKEEAQEQRARQMTMFKEMQESQSALLRELLRRMPSPTLQQLNYWHSGNQPRFSTDTAGSSSVQNTSQQDVIFNPHTSTSFME